MTIVQKTVQEIESGTLPLCDGVLVAVCGTGHGTLAAEAQRTQQLPDMARGIPNAGLGLDHVSHTGTGP
jgi:hypothetical protein